MSYTIKDYDTRTGNSQTENAKCVYSYLKYKGCTDNQIAGVLGNWVIENSLDPTVLEAGYLFTGVNVRFSMNPQKEAAVNDISAYTLDKVFPAYARSGISLNKPAYKGSDGKYYCGIGFGQFTGPAAQKLIGTAIASKQYWWARDYQLAYAFSVYRSGFLSGYKNYNGSASDCAYYFADKWEGNTYIHVAEKRAKAAEWVNKLKGFTVDTDYAQAVDALAKRLNPSYETGGAPSYMSGSGSLFASPEKLYTSNNYGYIVDQNSKEEKKPTAKELLRQVTENLRKSIEQVVDTPSTDTNSIINVANIIKDIVISKTLKDVGKYNEKPKTIVQGSVGSSVLPVVTEFVEAPYFEVEIGGIKFGGYHDNKIPNYVRSLSVKKTNGTINDYTIQLVHQIRPGDNPNYIDNVLSKVGYDIITIKYGNANTRQIFQDYEALITDVHENFDFTNCNINYTIMATSVCSVLDSQKHNYPPYTGKISDKIRQLLYEDVTSGLLNVFKGMSNKFEVEKEGLIPTNDSVVSIGAVSNVTAFQYLQILISKMENNSSKNKSLSTSQYFLTVVDSVHGTKFKIKEVVNSVKSVPFMYEVNVGYPDDNFVLNFSVNTNFSWAIAYESTKKIKRYEYELDSLGNLQRQNIPAYYRNKDDVVGSRNLWTSLTRYPIDATLTVRGLLQDSLLMQYIKINNVVYGAKRINSGVYIVTEQVDNIGNGVYTTTLSLTRVAGDDEYINIDGRVIT